MDVKRVDLTGRKGATIKVRLQNIKPGERYYITAKDPNGKTVFYERFASKQNVSFNLPKHTPSIDLGVIGRPEISSYLVCPLEKVNIELDLPIEATRPFQVKDIKFAHNTSMHSPARFHTKYPLIEINPIKMAIYSYPVQVFIKYHELGHYLYDREFKADLWATVAFLNDGFNISSAVFALDVLSVSKENINRVLTARPILDYLNKRYYN